MKKQPFYLSKRKLPSGKTVYYYYCYDFNGNRTVPKSTGCSKKSEAMEYCIDLLQKVDFKSKRWLLSEYATIMYEDNSKYITIRTLTAPLKENSINLARSNIKNHITPYFKGYYIDEIDFDSILKFNQFLKTKKLSPNSCVSVINTLKAVFSFAFSEGVIRSNPVKAIRLTKQVVTVREAFSYDEVIDIMTSKKWVRNYDCWLYCLVGVLTGMRLSEVNGLKSEDIHEDYISIKHQFVNGKITLLKNKSPRFACIPKKLYRLLKKHSDNSYFAFQGKTQYEPIDKHCVSYRLECNLPDYLKKERTSRLLTFHAFRYFLNTYLLTNEISPVKVNFIIGHKTGNSMQELYTTLKPYHCEDVIKLQTKLLDDILSKCDWLT